MPGTKFGSLQELAAHLIDKMYVDTRSKSAYSVIAAIQKKTIRPPEASGTYLKKLKILIQLIGNRKQISSFLSYAYVAGKAKRYLPPSSSSFWGHFAFLSFKHFTGYCLQPIFEVVIFLPQSSTIFAPKLAHL